MRKIVCSLAFLLGVCSLQAKSTDQTPLMGWSSWNTFLFRISDKIICDQADAMVKSGLKDAGYKYINIDDGFFGGRDEDGNLLIHPTRFPNGLRPVVDYIHSLGLKAGIYSDGGRNTCSGFFDKEPTGRGVGLYGHDQADCNLFFKDLDFDFIKIDFCGGFAKNNSENLQLSERDRYTDIYRAIQATGKKNVRVNACRWEYPGTWVDKVAGSWRTTHDIFCKWGCIADIIQQNLYLSAYSSAGHFNDMDMLEVGRGLKPEEDKTHFALWCMMNSPLLVGCDMTKMSKEALALMSNKRLIALNQDPLCQQAYPCQKVKGCFVLVKDLEKQNGKKRAVAIYNPNGEVKDVVLPLADIDLSEVVKVTDCYTGADVTQQVVRGSQIQIAKIPAHGTAVYTIEAKTHLERTYYEAETAYNPSYQELENNQAKGTGWYDYDKSCRSGMKATWLGGNEDNRLEFKHVYRKRTGMCEITVDYLSGEDRSLTLSVNGNKVKKFTCNSGGDDKHSVVTVRTMLKKGDNVIALYNNHSRMPDIDYLKIENVKP